MKKTNKRENSKESLEGNTEEVNESAKDSEQLENTEVKKFSIPGTCQECGSDDIEYGDRVDSDSEWNFDNGTTITYTYHPFTCNKCNCKAREVYIDKFSHTEIVDEEE